MDNPTDGNIVALWRLTEKHREVAGENNEGFLLFRMHVALTVRSGLVAPEVRASVAKADQRVQFGYVSSGLVGFVGAREPVKLVG